MLKMPTYFLLSVTMFLGSGCGLAAQEKCEQICECPESEDCMETCKLLYRAQRCGMGDNDLCHETMDDLSDCLEENGCGGCEEEFYLKDEACYDECSHM